MYKDLSENQRLLADLMSNISERCYYSGWQAGLEYVLWTALLNGPTNYGHDFITQDDIDSLRKLSNQSNCWIIFDEKLEETAIDLSVWKNKYKFETIKKL